LFVVLAMKMKRGEGAKIHVTLSRVHSVLDWGYIPNLMGENRLWWGVGDGDPIHLTEQGRGGLIHPATLQPPRDPFSTSRHSSVTEQRSSIMSAAGAIPLLLEHETDFLTVHDLGRLAQCSKDLRKVRGDFAFVPSRYYTHTHSEYTYVIFFPFTGSSVQRRVGKYLALRRLSNSNHLQSQQGRPVELRRHMET
jgi:hypothetical protein